MNAIEDLLLYLSRFSRRLRLYDGWLLAQRTLWLAMAGMALVQLVGRLFPILYLGLWTLMPLIVWMIINLGYSLFRPLGLMQTARRIDAGLALKERLSTAVWLANTSVVERASPLLVAAQQQDALAQARAISSRSETLSTAFSLRWLPKHLLTAGVLAILTLALGLLPNPMEAVLAERAIVAEAAHQQAAEIEKLEQSLDEEVLSSQERQELLRKLEELAKALRDNSGDRQEALADLSKFEEALRQRVDVSVTDRRAALEALIDQMQSLSEQRGWDVDPKQSAEWMERLAEALAEMSSSERQELGTSLANLAVQSAQAGDQNLAGALANLAQAVQSGHPGDAKIAGQMVSHALAQSQARLQAQDVLQHTLRQVQSSRQAIAQAGQRSGAGQSLVGGQNPAQSAGPGTLGGGGTKADSLPPGSSSGRAETPRGQAPSASSQGLDRQIYTPLIQPGTNDEQLTISGQDSGQGQSQISQGQGALPGAVNSALVPYQQVYTSYLTAASQAIERSPIPAGLKTIVQQYFTLLEP